jgi:DMSO/TMAO reductase YedYZ molybdopterin-dependent catalytic subunit
MSADKQRAQEEALVNEALRTGGVSDRRRFFVSAAAFGAAAAAPLAASAQAAPGSAPAAPAAPPRRVLVKSDARLLNIGATVRSGNYWNFSTYITPLEEFYVRNHYPTPLVADKPVLDPKNWKLKIHGNAVERPIEITYDDLMKMPSRFMIATLECHGNARTIFWEQLEMKEVAGGNWVMGAVGQAEWQYVPMSHIFNLVGLKKGAKSALFWSGVDGGDMGRPIPVADLTSRADDIGICFRMNGNELTPDHGAPVRMVVPGWGGTAWIKWLTEIRIDSHQHWCRLNTRGEVYIGPEYKAPEVTPTDEFIGGITAAGAGEVALGAGQLPAQARRVAHHGPRSTDDARLRLGAAARHPPRRVPHRRRTLAARQHLGAEPGQVHLGALRLPVGCNRRRPRDRNARHRHGQQRPTRYRAVQPTRHGQRRCT